MSNVANKTVEKIKTHFVYNNLFLKKNHAFLRDNVEIYCRAGHAKDDNMAHFTLGTKGYTHTHTHTHTHTNTEYVILIAFTRQQSCTNVPQ
jgi:hypothetical protein